MADRIRGIHELYSQDPIAADEQLFGRKSHGLTRRGFLRGLSAMTAVLGAELVYAHNMPAGMIPAALAHSNVAFRIEGKDPGLVVLNDRPVNAETPAHLLDDQVTPASRLFVRNNGHPPIDPDKSAWRLSVAGEAAQGQASFSIAELTQKFALKTFQITLECGGNGRAEFDPPARGNQWTTGAVGCPQWTGVSLRDVLQAVGVAENAVYLAYEGADLHLSGDPDKRPISRGVPIAKAMEPESLIAWQINGQDLPLMNGFPLRLVIGGYPGSVSGKWIKRLLIRDRVHDGAKMGGSSYRVPCDPVVPGQKVNDEDMCIIEAMPVKSLITYPRSGITHSGGALTVRGHAWTSLERVAALHVSIDFGQTWQEARLAPPVNRFAWQRWQTSLNFPKPGYYEIWARATDGDGKRQPMVLPGWNPKGYLNNACHRVAVRVG